MGQRRRLHTRAAGRIRNHDRRPLRCRPHLLRRQIQHASRRTTHPTHTPYNTYKTHTPYIPYKTYILYTPYKTRTPFFRLSPSDYLGLHRRYAEILGNDTGLSSLCLSKKEEEIDTIAKKWASVISNKYVREQAEEAARIALRHGVKVLPELREADLGKVTKYHRVSASFQESMDGVLPSIIRVNKRAYKGWETAQANAVRWGQLVQDNALLHELGHYIDFCNDPDNYRKLEHNWNLENMDKDLIKKHLSTYATSDYAEFEAELNAAIMKGKVLPKELLSYSHMNKVDTELAKSLLSLGAGEDVCLPSEDISKGFKDAMKVLFNQKGSSFSIDIMADKNVQSLIEAHATVLDRNLQRVEMSDIMRQRLQRSNYIFSGIKTFHELNEAFPSLLDENGNRKPFERFLNDVQKINDTYNRGYLRAEYNFVQSSAQMAAKWEQFAEDGDRYNLQYRTVGDSKVRPEHAALNGVTLPPSDPFWQTYYPPNGWNCRCTVVQVRKAKYPVTPHDEAMKRGEEALQNDTKGIFHFNPGIQQKTMPDYNPYTIRRCRDCDIAKGKLNLGFVPENELCAACKLVHKCQDLKGCVPDEIYGNRLLISKQADQSEIVPNTRAARALVSSFPDMTMQIRKDVVGFQVKNPEYLINGMIADRKGIESPKGIQSGFKKAIKQGCQAVVIDLDMHMRDGKLPISELAKYLNWRSPDFENEVVKECYVIYHDKAIKITAEHKGKEMIKAELEKLKP